jgi:hypothetical protein
MQTLRPTCTTSRPLTTTTTPVAGDGEMTCHAQCAQGGESDLSPLVPKPKQRFVTTRGRACS